MSFWSGEKLKKELPTLLGSQYSESRVDCAAYVLTVGEEVYVSPTGDNPKEKYAPKTRLRSVGSSCVIPPGQFAFILTEERVKIPENAIAFISMRSRVKFRGLVNVSGFHVDPGYEGKLIFAVFNAGPSPIHVARGDEWFLIWYADLDRFSREVKSSSEGIDQIRSDMINPIGGEIQSLEGLLNKIKETDEKLTSKINVLERDHAVVKWATALVLGALIAIGAYYARGIIWP